MRAGYTAKGIVYVLVGLLAALAALKGGRVPDSRDALGTLLTQPFGRTVLGFIGAGLFGYCVWRLAQAAMDLDDKGSDAKGWLARAAQASSGLVYLLLAVSASLSSWRGLKDDSDNTDSWTATFMSEPGGQWLVGLFGLVVVAFAGLHFKAAYQRKYRDSMRYTHVAAKLDPVLRFGLAAHGVVVFIIGAFFLWAAWTAEPSHAGGLRDALITVRSASFGRWLLMLVSAGLVSFGIYCFIEAVYRVVPRCRTPDLETLASKARAMRAEADRAVASTLDGLERGIRGLANGR